MYVILFHVKQTNLTSTDYSDLLDFLYKKNQTTNLTRISNKDDAQTKHIVDSLELSNYIQTHLDDVNTILDMGTGAGFPGLVIAKENPKNTVYLIDSSNKKIQFVTQAVELLNLENAFPVHSRIEDFASSKALFFDLIVARSLAYLDVLLEYSTPLLKTGGYLLAMKSENTEEELSSILHVLEPLGFSSPTEYKYTLAESDRVILSFNKTRESSIKLPRRAGMATKKPIRRVI